MKARIVVVERDEPTRKSIASILEPADYGCRMASADGILALSQSGEEFDLVLASPVPADVAESLLASTKDRLRDVPVVIVAASEDVQIARHLVRKGAYEYLLKPFDPEDLLSMVGRALESRRLKLEHRAYQTNLEGLVVARTEQLRQAITTLEQSYDITLNALGQALDLKEGQTEGHSKRVTAFTIAIARAMGLSADEIRIIARGAYLHDVGKMAVHDMILRKPGSLTPEETAAMREHCFRGFEMLRHIPFLAEAAQIVYCHHENYDGTGYPRGLKGDQIPLGARITAVANTLDSMTSDLPYRAKSPFSVARDEIQRWSGRQFDPQVVASFLQMPENIWDDLRKGVDQQIRRDHPVQ